MAAPPPMPFSGHAAIVIGGTRGLGFQYASDLAKLGANVVITGRGEDAVLVAERLSYSLGQVVGLRCDIKDADPAIAAAVERFGKVDSLIVNAGIVRDRSFAKMRDDEWSQVIDVHLNGSYACAKAIWPIMQAQRHGSILFTTSGAGMHGAFGQANYAAAKAGIIGLMKSLALEGKKSGIRVNALAPMANTDMTDGIFTDQMCAELSADDVSPFALALVHPNCDYSGEIIECGGGWAAALRWQRAQGLCQTPQPQFEAVQSQIRKIFDYDLGYDTPNSTIDSLNAALKKARHIIK